jgi:hypothetical protein
MAVGSQKYEREKLQYSKEEEKLFKKAYELGKLQYSNMTSSFPRSMSLL